MRVLLQHIVAFLAVVVIAASCSRDKAEIIPRSKMARIYAEMLMTDQWINARTDVRRIADTSLVYEPILQKYGYDHMDYLKTVDEYMDDPERFARILRESGDIIEERLKDLRWELEQRNKLEALRKRIEEMTIESDFKAEEFFPYLFGEPYVHYYDSLVIEIDSVIQHYRFQDVPTTDTLYDGVRMLLQLDSLELADSLTLADSLAVKDSIAVRDSLAKVDSLAKAAKAAKKTRTTNQAIKIAEDEILFN